MKKMVVLLLSSFLCVLFLCPVAMPADSDKAPAVIADTVAVRPVGLASILIGSVVFIVSLPFAITSGSVGETADTLIGEPFRFTFERPVGDFGEVRDSY